jgi:hypothetical protein
MSKEDATSSCAKKSPLVLKPGENIPSHLVHPMIVHEFAETMAVCGLTNPPTEVVQAIVRLSGTAK